MGGWAASEAATADATPRHASSSKVTVESGLPHHVGAEAGVIPCTLPYTAGTYQNLGEQTWRVPLDGSGYDVRLDACAGVPLHGPARAMESVAWLLGRVVRAGASAEARGAPAERAALSVSAVCAELRTRAALAEDLRVLADAAGEMRAVLLERFASAFDVHAHAHMAAAAPESASDADFEHLKTMFPAYCSFPKLCKCGEAVGTTRRPASGGTATGRPNSKSASGGGRDTKARAGGGAPSGTTTAEAGNADNKGTARGNTNMDAPPDSAHDSDTLGEGNTDVPLHLGSDIGLVRRGAALCAVLGFEDSGVTLEELRDRPAAQPAAAVTRRTTPGGTVAELVVCARCARITPLSLLAVAGWEDAPRRREGRRAPDERAALRAALHRVYDGSVRCVALPLVPSVGEVDFETLRGVADRAAAVLNRTGCEAPSGELGHTLILFGASPDTELWGKHARGECLQRAQQWLAAALPREAWTGGDARLWHEVVPLPLRGLVSLLLAQTDLAAGLQRGRLAAAREALLHAARALRRVQIAEVLYNQQTYSMPAHALVAVRAARQVMTSENVGWEGEPRDEAPPASAPDRDAERRELCNTLRAMERAAPDEGTQAGLRELWQTAQPGPKEVTKDVRRIAEELRGDAKPAPAHLADWKAYVQRFDGRIPVAVPTARWLSETRIEVLRTEADSDGPPGRAPPEPAPPAAPYAYLVNQQWTRRPAHARAYARYFDDQGVIPVAPDAFCAAAAAPATPMTPGIMSPPLGIGQLSPRETLHWGAQGSPQVLSGWGMHAHVEQPPPWGHHSTSKGGVAEGQQQQSHTGTARGQQAKPTTLRMEDQRASSTKPPNEDQPGKALQPPTWKPPSQSNAQPTWGPPPSPQVLPTWTPRGSPEALPHWTGASQPELQRIWTPQGTLDVHRTWTPPSNPDAPSLWVPPSHADMRPMWAPQAGVDAPSIWPQQGTTDAPCVWPAHIGPDATCVWTTPGNPALPPHASCTWDTPTAGPLSDSGESTRGPHAATLGRSLDTSRQSSDASGGDPRAPWLGPGLGLPDVATSAWATAPSFTPPGHFSLGNMSPRDQLLPGTGSAADPKSPAADGPPLQTKHEITRISVDTRSSTETGETRVGRRLRSASTRVRSREPAKPRAPGPYKGGRARKQWGAPSALVAALPGGAEPAGVALRSVTGAPIERVRGVCFSKTENTWTAWWRHQGKRKKKVYRVRQFGYEQAKLNATRYRVDIDRYKLGMPPLYTTCQELKRVFGQL